jgi:pimeloyl-ACP methyl ester carboxylesterase
MALPALVLVHGGGLAADSWDLTVEELHRLAPELTVLALDMPGRRNKPGDLREMAITDYVDSLVGDIENAELEDIVIAAHSMGGLPLPGVVTKLGAARVREVIFAASFLPPEGTSIVDGSPWHIAVVARAIVKRNVPTPTPRWMVRFMFMNGVSSHRRRFLTGKLYESHCESSLRRSRRECPRRSPAPGF